MPQTNKRIKAPVNGTVDRKLDITGSGEQHYYAHRQAAIPSKDFTRQGFHDALRQASRPVSEPESKEKTSK